MLRHTGLMSSNSFQITTLTACINLKIQPLWLWKVILSLFIHVKSIKVISGFNLRKWKKSARWLCHTEKSKTNLKKLISPLLTRPQGPQGCQKMRHHPLNKLMEVWCANIEPKLQKVWKTVRKQAFLTIFFQFWRFFKVSSILAQF